MDDPVATIFAPDDIVKAPEILALVTLREDPVALISTPEDIFKDPDVIFVVAKLLVPVAVNLLA
jgi:hypothetical protein